nr:Rpn family recombination-promoting nuclease/putative transposase [uncultured Blautia sp.]
MQLLRYMCVIWQEYKATQNKIKKSSSHNKDFRYPLIIPIVYYEGKRKWTAGLNLRDRIEFVDEMEKYIPDFTYQVVSVNQYTNEELSRKHDEMSLVMLINKIQSAEDLAEFRKISEEIVDNIYGNAPEEIKEIYKKILWSLLMKLQVPGDEAQEIMGGIGGRGMGYLFENMDKMDIQAERRNTKREKERADAAEQQRDIAEQQRDAAEQQRDIAEQQRDIAEQRAEQMAKEMELMKKKVEEFEKSKEAH